MKNLFQKPELEVIKLETNDVVVTSGLDESGGNPSADKLRAYQY